MNWKQLLSIDTKRARSRIKASDIRSDFDKDYHRIISSPSLEGYKIKHKRSHWKKMILLEQD